MVLNLSKLNRLNFILLLTLSLYVVVFILNFVLGIIISKDIVFINLQNNNNSIVLLAISSVFIAPIIETFLGQSLPYFLLYKIKFIRERNYIIVLISALFFGLIHFYSLFYVIYGIIVGSIFIYGYMARIQTDKKTFILIAISHSLLNLGILIKNII